MKRTHFTSLFLLVALLFALGCESYPMGMSKEEWVLLSPEQQAQARQQQAAIDAENRRIAAEEEARQRQIDADEHARRQAELEHRYSHARYGDIVSITVEGGQMKFSGDHRTYEPVAFDLVRGESKTIVFRRDDKPKYTLSVVVRLSDDGRTFYFDDSSSKRLTFIEKTWDRGQVYTIAIHRNGNSEPKNVNFTLRYRPVRGRY